MAIKLLVSLFDFDADTIIRDLSFNIEKRLVNRGAATYDLTDGTNATVPTLSPDLTEIEKQVVLLEQLLLTNRNKSTLEPFAPADWVQHGLYDYNDAATATTPISVPATSTLTELTNDAAGEYTNKTYALPDVADVWDATNNRFDFSSLSLGDKVEIRLDVQVTTTAAYQDIDIVLVMAEGTEFEYEIPFINLNFKTAQANDLNRFNAIYMGDENTLGNYAKFKIKSDAAATVIVNGWFVCVTPRFAKTKV